MGYLLDTCLLSEVWRPSPNAGVIEWLGGSMEEELFVSALSLGELKKGIEKLPESRKKTRLARDYVLLRSRFSSRVLAVTDVIAERWGDLSASAERSGRHIHVVDGLIAATALVLGLTVVTRNVDDFATIAVPLNNPWT
ncbi:MAG TPA: type II toxin-antitoxin system VapC family toxin [Polyangiaceae bacterium]